MASDSKISIIHLYRLKKAQSSDLFSLLLSETRKYIAGAKKLGMMETKVSWTGLLSSINKQIKPYYFVFISAYTTSEDLSLSDEFRIPLRLEEYLEKVQRVINLLRQEGYLISLLPEGMLTWESYLRDLYVSRIFFPIT